jgi:hypothetical protein
MDVCDVGGDKVGSIAAVHHVSEVPDPAPASMPDVILEVKTGLLGLGKHLYVPMSAVQEALTESVFLARPRPEYRTHLGAEHFHDAVKMLTSIRAGIGRIDFLGAAKMSCRREDPGCAPNTGARDQRARPTGARRDPSENLRSTGLRRRLLQHRSMIA